MSSIRNIRLLAALLLSVMLAPAAAIFDSGIHSLNAADPQQTGRLFRDNIISDWSAPKAFPGTTATGSLFSYQAFVIPNITLPYIQIDFFDVNNTGSTFTSAYLNTYQPNLGLNVNYLGDAGGASGNFSSFNPRSFQVIVPSGNNLVVVVSGTGSGLNQPFQFLVEGFYNSNFSEVPEPATYSLLVAAAAILLVSAIRRTLS